MSEIRSANHTRWECKYHIVFIPKYRKKVIYGEIKKDAHAKSQAHGFLNPIISKWKSVDPLFSAFMFEIYAHIAQER